MRGVLYNPLGATEGHAQDYIENLCIGLCKNRASVTLVSARNFSTEKLRGLDCDFVWTSELDTRRNTESQKFLLKIKYGLGTVLNSFGGARYLNQALMKSKADFCLLAGGSTLGNLLLLPYFLMRHVDTKFGLTFHNADLSPNIHSSNKVKWFYKALQYCAAKIMSKTRLIFFCHGHFMQRSLASQLRIPHKSVRVHMVPMRTMQTGDQPEMDEKQVTRLLFFGVIRHDKGLDLLCQALARIDCDRYPWHLTVAGTERHVGKSYVMDCVSSLNNDQVTLSLKYFNDEEREKVLNNCHVVVMPYRKTFMAQSVVMVDAMLHRKPVITSKESENGEHTIKYSAGLCFEAENVDSLEQALIQMLRGDAQSITSKARFEDFAFDHAPKTVGLQIIEGFGR